MFDNIILLEIPSLATIGSVASILGVLIAAYLNRDRILKLYSKYTGKTAEEKLLKRLFGEEIRVERADEDYGERIRSAASNSYLIYRLSGNTKRIDGMDDFEQFKDPNVTTRLLIINPVPKTESNFGDYTALDIEKSLGRDQAADLSFLKGRYGGIKQYLEEDGDWEETRAQAYGTTPWIRMILFKGDEEQGWNEAGFTFSPTLADFNNQTPKFWTTDPAAIKTLRSIYEDIWNDPRTEKYSDMYDRIFGDSDL
jgi:hypothetical protein